MNAFPLLSELSTTNWWIETVCHMTPTDLWHRVHLGKFMQLLDECNILSIFNSREVWNVRYVNLHLLCMNRTKSLIWLQRCLQHSSCCFPELIRMTAANCNCNNCNRIFAALRTESVIHMSCRAGCLFLFYRNNLCQVWVCVQSRISWTTHSKSLGWKIWTKTSNEILHDINKQFVCFRSLA